MELHSAETKGERLRRLRVRQGHTRRSLARELGLSEGTIRRAEGDLPLLATSAKKLADFYGLEVTDIPLSEAA